uniref:Uncharacterized protein n=1 Tax=Oryza nivara TaxID=4536 RepID=A0A0E0IDT1_ORYNI
MTAAAPHRPRSPPNALAADALPFSRVAGRHTSSLAIGRPSSTSHVLEKLRPCPRPCLGCPLHRIMSWSPILHESPAIAMNSCQDDALNLGFCLLQEEPTKNWSKQHHEIVTNN